MTRPEEGVQGKRGGNSTSESSAREAERCLSQLVKGGLTTLEGIGRASAAKGKETGEGGELNKSKEVKPDGVTWEGELKIVLEDDGGTVNIL